MAKTILTFDTLGDLDDGNAKLAVNRALALFLTDLDERGSDEEKRTLTIKLHAKRKDDLTQVWLEAGYKGPGYGTGKVAAKSEVKRGQAQLVFQPGDNSDPDQETMPFEETN